MVVTWTEERSVTKDEFWRRFVNSCINATTLKQELTRVTSEPVTYHPNDWAHVNTVEEVAEGLGLTCRAIREWIADGKLRAKRIGRSFYISRASQKELLSYDESKLKDVPWEALKEPPRYATEHMGHSMAWINRMAEARLLAKESAQLDRKDDGAQSP